MFRLVQSSKPDGNDGKKKSRTQGCISAGDPSLKPGRVISITPINPIRTAKLLESVMRSDRTGTDSSKVNKGAEKTSAVASARIAPENATKDSVMAIIPAPLRIARSNVFRVFKILNPPLNWIKKTSPRKVHENRTNNNSATLNSSESSLTRKLMREKQKVLLT